MWCVLTCTDTDIGWHTCGGYPGLEGYETRDIETFASWGIDSLKVDGCYANAKSMNVTYPQLSEILVNASIKYNQPIVYSCSWPGRALLIVLFFSLIHNLAYAQGSGYPIQYQLMAQYCNMWRNYGDITSDWWGVANIIDFWGEANGVDYNNFVNVARPGAINDPDQAS